jgi:two-component system, OmpR family, response regulator VicR
MKNGQQPEPEARPRRVLVVDPDPAVRREVRRACEQDGFEVLEGESGEQALAAFQSARPLVVLLELGLPDQPGLEVCRELRQLDADVVIIIISARSDEVDVVVGLEVGADDYLVKPLRLRELTARIAATLRRLGGEPAETRSGRLEFKDLVVDVNERRVLRQGREITLTHTEFDLLALLAANAGKVLSRERMLQSVWGYQYPVEIETRVIDVHIRNLRRKVEEEPSRPFFILAVPGIGYRFTNARPES